MLTDSGRAIGAVSRLLSDRLSSLGVAVTVGRPEPTPTTAKPRVNIFLYEVDLDPSLRNHPLDASQPAPLWLVLRYLLTAFDQDGESDSADAHVLLGSAMRRLHELNFLRPTGVPAAVIAALDDNPEPLKVTFRESSSDLLARIMQGSDEKYRCSVAFEVRPVMITAGPPPSVSLLVGIDYEHAVVVGDEGVHIAVLPSMGPTLTDVSPTSVAARDELIVAGSNLDLDRLSARLGGATVPIIAQRPDALRCQVDGAIEGGTVVSAGSQALTIEQRLPDGRVRASNPVIVGLRPSVTNVTPVGITHVAGPASPVFGNVDIDGVLLGTDQDEVFVALYRAGKTVRFFDSLAFAQPPVTPQTRVTVRIPQADPIDPGSYLVVVRVNGQQARESLEVALT